MLCETQSPVGGLGRFFLLVGEPWSKVSSTITVIYAHNKELLIIFRVILIKNKRMQKIETFIYTQLCFTMIVKPSTSAKSGLIPSKIVISEMKHSGQRRPECTGFAIFNKLS